MAVLDRQGESTDLSDFRDAVRSFVRDVVEPGSAETDALGEPPLGNYKRAAELGILGLTVPVEFGGQGAPQVYVSAAVEEISRGCASTAMMIAAPLVVAEVVAVAGGPEMCARYLPGFADGSCLPAFALTEPDAGTDIRSMRSVVRRREDGTLVLDGRKTYITNGGIADVLVVFAKEESASDRRISAFVIDAHRPGVTAGRPLEKLGLHGSNTVELLFDDVAIQESDRLGAPGEGDGIAIATLDRARLNTAAQATGIAAAAVELCVRFAQTRVQFGRAIADFQAVQLRVADMAMQLQAARLVLGEASRQFDELAADPGARGATTALAKVFCSEAASTICNQAVVTLGGMGFMREGQVERLLRDCKGTQIYDGTNDINRMTLAKHLLEGGSRATKG